MNPGMNVVVDYLSSVPAWYLATSEGDQPHVRPFSFVAGFSDRIWFCTGKGKDVYRELQANPKFEVSAWKPAHGWLVLRGEADFIDEVNDLIRRAGFAHMRSLGEEYDGVEDPNLVFFSVREPQAWVRDIDGSEVEVDFSGEPFALPEQDEPKVDEAPLEASTETPLETPMEVEPEQPMMPATPETSTFIVEQTYDDTLQQPEAFYAEEVNRTDTYPS